MNAESRIAALEAQLAEFMHETRSRLDDHKEDIGALAEAVNAHGARATAHAVALRDIQDVIGVKK